MTASTDERLARIEANLENLTEHVKECRKEIKAWSAKGIFQAVQTHSRVMWMMAAGLAGLAFDRFRQ